MRGEVAMSDIRRRARCAAHTIMNELLTYCPLHTERREINGRVREGGREGGISWVTAISRNMPLASLSTFGIRRQEGREGNGKTARETS